MPPKGQKRTTVGGVFDREDDVLQERIAQILEPRMDQIMEALTERMADMFERVQQRAPRTGGQRQRQQDWEVEDDGEAGEFYEEIPQVRRRQPRVPVEDDNRRWEAGMRTEIQEFHGGLQAEEFLDWLATVEEVFEFKGVPEDRRVPLIATRLRGRASAWWQQLKLSRVRLGKSKIVTWDKMKKQMRAAFLPYNYQRTLYQRLQNLRQGQNSVDDYTTEFY